MAIEEIDRLRGRDFVGSPREFVLGRMKDDDRTRLRAAAFAIAAACGLDDRVERAERAEGDGEIDIDTGFDELVETRRQGSPAASASRMALSFS